MDDQREEPLCFPFLGVPRREVGDWGFGFSLCLLLSVCLSVSQRTTGAGRVSTAWPNACLSFPPPPLRWGDCH